MRDFKGMKRSRSRNRRSSGSSGGQNNNPNRSFDSTGPEGIKVRGNAQTVYERYQQLARDATSSGDRILAENYLQHAEHYFRLLRIMQPNRPVSEIAAREGANAGFDIDFEDESGTQFAQVPQQQQQPQGGQGAQDNAEGGQPQASGDNTSGGERAEGEGQPSRRESRRERYERRRQERWGAEGQEGRDEGGEGESESADPLAVIEPAAAEASDIDTSENHMPSFLTRSTPAPATSDEDGEAAPAPRRTRTRKPKAAAETSDGEG